MYATQQFLLPVGGSPRALERSSARNSDFGTLAPTGRLATPCSPPPRGTPRRRRSVAAPAGSTAAPLAPASPTARPRSRRSVYGFPTGSASRSYGFPTEMSAKARKHRRNDRRRAGGLLRAFSPVFGRRRALAQTTVISGRTVRVGFPKRFSGRARSHLRSSYRAHTGLRARRDPAYAITHTRMLPLPRAGRLDAGAVGNPPTNYKRRFGRPGAAAPLGRAGAVSQSACSHSESGSSSSAYPLPPSCSAARASPRASRALGQLVADRSAT